MIFEFLPSFDEVLRTLGPERRERVAVAIEGMVDYFETRKGRPITLRRLRNSYWLVRASLQDRVLMIIEREHVRFLLVGSTGDIIRFLRS